MPSGGGRRAVFVKRFDRGAGPGFCPTPHFVSALSLLDLDDTSLEGSYLQVAAVLGQKLDGPVLVCLSGRGDKDMDSVEIPAKSEASP